MKNISKYVIGLFMFTVMVLFVVGCSKNVPSGITTTPSIPSNNVQDTQDTSPTQTPAIPNLSDASTGSDSGTNIGTVKELNIEAYNFGFRVLNDVIINKGDTVRLTVSSAEGTHGFAMPAFNVNLGSISPGTPKTAEFIADQSGSFSYFCNIPCGPGHSSMRATLVVT